MLMLAISDIHYTHILVITYVLQLRARNDQMNLQNRLLKKITFLSDVLKIGPDKLIDNICLNFCKAYHNMSGKSTCSP